MGYFGALDISASGLTAQRLRMDAISQNIANVSTTHTANGGPYRRKVALFEERTLPPDAFDSHLHSQMNDSYHNNAFHNGSYNNGSYINSKYSNGSYHGGYYQDGYNSVGIGVRVARIFEDSAPFKKVYEPGHPDADADGYVELPNVDVVTEMINMISASRSYEANVTSLNATKSMAMKALEIGR